MLKFGCGYWAPTLLRNFFCYFGLQSENCRRPSEDRRKVVPNNYPQTTATADLAAWIDKSNRAVVIATPAATHFNLAREALQSDKHTLVEKPVAMSVNEADELLKLARARNLILMAGHTFLFNGILTRYHWRRRRCSE